MPGDEYRTVRDLSTGIFKDRGSKFIAHAFRIASTEDVKARLEEVKKEYRDARHHCYAYRIGMDNNNWRVNDDGEPSGSAGKPILGQINSFQITNVLIVVVRYFGGTLLGVGGLINAYKSAAREALQNNTIVRELVKVNLHLSFPYESINSVMKIIKEEKLDHSKQVFEIKCSLDLQIRESEKDRIISRLKKIDGISFS